MDKEPKKAPLLKIQNLNNVKFMCDNRYYPMLTSHLIPPPQI